MQETPGLQALRKTSDTYPAFLIPRLMATQQFAAMQADARERVNHSWEVEKRELDRLQGAKITPSNGEADMAPLSPISVQGDTFNFIGGSEKPPAAESPATAPAQPAATQPAAPPATGNGIGSMLWPLLLGPVIGAGGYAIYDYFTGTPTVINEQSDTQDWKLGVKVTDQP